MRFLTDAIERLRAVLFRGREERELDEELRFHVDREVAERVRHGADPAAARREALVAFGGVEPNKEAVRDARGTRGLEDLASDLRYAVRGLRRNPGFTATAVLVLGLGIGATTAVFSVMHSVVLAELPYASPDQLVIVSEQNSPTNIWNISTADAAAIRAQQRSFAAWGEVSRTSAALSGGAAPIQITVGRASAGFFAALGVPAAAGRLIEPADEPDGAPAVLVVSHAEAERSFGGVEGALGRAVTLDGVSHEIVGVLPPGRDDLAGYRAGAWTALKLPAPTRRGPFWMRGLGRLKEGVTIDMAAADLAGISARLLPVWGDFRDSVARLTPMPLRERIVGKADRQVGLFAGAVFLVLLLAITNVATLVLVRASAREPEVAVRVMLGAGKGRIARLLVTENLMLTLMAGAVGLVLAWLGLRLAISELPNLPRIQDATLDWRAIAFALSAALVSGILVSLSPVAALVDRGTAQRGDVRRAGTARGTNRLRGALVTAEFALALPLLVGAGLLLNSFVRLSRVDPGFDPDGVVAVGLALPPARYPDEEIAAFWRRAELRVAELPGTVAAGVVSNAPPENPGTNNFNLVDHPVPDGQSEPVAPWYQASAGYFQALGIPVLDGRLFTPADTAVPVVVVSRAWANRYFPRERAVGRQLISGGCYDCPRTVIIGIVGDVKNLGLAESEEAVYSPINLTRTRSMSLVVRSTSGTAAALRSLRESVRSLDPELPMTESTLAERYDATLADPRRWTVVLAAFAAVGVVLAALGIFGLMSYVVRQRRREIGVRLALGAEPKAMTRFIIARGVRYAIAGSVLGLIVTLALVRRMGTLLFGVSPTDVRTIGAVAALLLLVAVAACWLPGYRAGRIRPLEAISTE
jgi:putative ABC transport system permease protein